MKRGFCLFVHMRVSLHHMDDVGEFLKFNLLTNILKIILSYYLICGLQNLSFWKNKFYASLTRCLKKMISLFN